MKGILLIKIFDVGTGTDETIGLVADPNDLNTSNILFSSAEYPGYYSGFINIEDQSLAGQTIDISQGGSLGGFDGDTSLTIVDQSFHDAVKEGTINLIGKVVNAQIVFDSGTPETEFTGKVSSIVFKDEITVELTCDSSISFDERKIPEVVITKEMAFNVEDSSAIGESIMPTYGNIVYYPMVYCPTDDSFLAASVQNTSSVMDVAAPDWLHSSDAQKDTYEMLSGSFDAARGKNILQIYEYYQLEENYIWITFSLNGNLLFNVEQDSSLLKQTFLGKRIKVVSGSGQGNTYKIIDVEWSTHDPITTVWFQVDESDVSALKTALHNNIDLTCGVSETSAVIVRKKATTNFFKCNQNENISTIVFLGIYNSFIISADADLSDGEIIYNNDGVIKKVAATPSLLYKYDKWKCIIFDFKDVSEKDSTINSSQAIKLTSYVFEDDGLFNSCNLYGDIYGYINDGLVARTVIPDGGFSIYKTFGDPGYETKNTYFIEIRDLIDNENIAKDFSNVSFIPRYSQEISATEFFSATDTQKIEIVIDLNVISDGNLVLEKKQFKKEIRLSFPESTYPQTAYFDIDPERKTIHFSSNVITYTGDSDALYEEMLEELKIDDIISNISDIKKINGILLNITVEYLTNGTTNLRHSAFNKQMQPCYCVYKISVDKEKLYWKTVKDSTVTSPAKLIEHIAQNNGLAVDTDLFATANESQLAMIGTVSGAYDGQYQADSDELVSDVLTSIASRSLTAVWQNKNGLVCAKSLSSVNDPVFTFNSDTVDGSSVEISRPLSGYVFSDYKFSVIRTPFETASSINIDTDLADEFPEQSDFTVGSFIFNVANGFAVESLELLTATPVETVRVVRLTISCDPTDKNYLQMFLAGTFWQIKYNDRIYVFRIDSSEHVKVISNNKVQRTFLGYVISSETHGVLFDFSLRLWGPSEYWRQFVSSPYITDYYDAYSIWNDAHNARASLGKEQISDSDTVTLDQPIWGSADWCETAISAWAANTVNYQSKVKTVIKFDSPITAGTIAVQLMDFALFSWGQFAGQNFSGFVVERTLNLSEGTISFTLLCAESWASSVIDEGDGTLSVTYDEIDEGDGSLSETFDILEEGEV